MTAALYHVRQYRPAYFTGFENSVMRNVSYEEILKAPWLDNFKSDSFAEFRVEPYGKDELIIIAHYKDGTHWVAGFAVNIDKEFAKNWRYQCP